MSKIEPKDGQVSFTVTPQTEASTTFGTISPISKYQGLCIEYSATKPLNVSLASYGEGNSPLYNKQHLLSDQESVVAYYIPMNDPDWVKSKAYTNDDDKNINELEFIAMNGNESDVIIKRIRFVQTKTLQAATTHLQMIVQMSPFTKGRKRFLTYYGRI